MAVWTVFEPGEVDEARTTLQWADGFVFVPERMSWSALVLAPLVLLRHGLWLALIAYLVVQGGLFAAIHVLDLDSTAFALLLVVNVAVAVQLPGLRRARLALRGFEETGCVVAPTLEAAEQRYFDARLAGTSAPVLPLPAPGAARVHAPARRVESTVLGLFPEASR